MSEIGKKNPVNPSLAFLGNTHPAVKSHLKATTDLSTFLASAGTLRLKGRRRLVDQALILMEQNYVHLPLKEAMHGVDPVQRLRLVKHRLGQATTSTMGSEYAFHREMLDIFNSVRDLHSNYLLAAPFGGVVAFLPFDIEEYFENGQPHFIATNFVQGFPPGPFRSGAEIKMWSGVPIERAIQVNANRHAGSNPAARRARGIESLTIRPLRTSLPPDEQWLVIGYTDGNGVERELRQDWLVAPPLPDAEGVDPDSVNEHSAFLGVDLGMDLVRRTKRMLYAPKAVAEARRKRRKLSKRRVRVGQALSSQMPEVFKAQSTDTPSGVYGHIRIFTFSVGDPESFVEEFIRIVELLPQDGLVLDVRGNGGGHIWASEGILQVLTPKEISPEPLQFINTPLNLRICKRHEDSPVGIDLGPWVESIRRSIETGAIYSRGFPITPHGFANRWGQRYHGPVVLITDARCYSATDFFAAGFQDHEIGRILGVDANTGAGGANVWTQSLLRDLLRSPSPADPDSPYESLPNQAGLRVSIRRSLRVGERSGTPLEDLGVIPDNRYKMSRDDLLQGNKDLINRAAEILASMPVRRLTVNPTQADGTLKIKVTTAGFSRLDIFIDGRPIESRDLDDGTRTLTVFLPGGAKELRVAGYDNGSLVAARKVEL